MSPQKPFECNKNNKKLLEKINSMMLPLLTSYNVYIFLASDDKKYFFLKEVYQKSLKRYIT